MVLLFYFMIFDCRVNLLNVHFWHEWLLCFIFIHLFDL